MRPIRSYLWILPIAFVGIQAVTASSAENAFKPASCSKHHYTLEELNTPKGNESYDTDQLTTWFDSKRSSSRGAVIVAHGLNTKPSKMNAIVDLFQRLGYDVLRVSLSGHRGSLEEFRHVNRETFLTDAMGAYCLAKTRADRVRGKVHLAAFSLGGVVFEDLMNLDAEEPVQLEKAVLFAPAVEVRVTSHLIKIFRLFGESFIVPSLNLREYRANQEGTSVAAYNGLFDAISSANCHQFRNSNIETKVFIDPDDELVNIEGIRSAIERFKLDRWELVQVSNEGSLLEKKYHHLIIDEDVTGKAQWEAMVSQIQVMFDGGSAD